MSSRGSCPWRRWKSEITAEIGPKGRSSPEKHRKKEEARQVAWGGLCLKKPPCWRERWKRRKLNKQFLWQWRKGQKNKGRKRYWRKSEVKERPGLHANGRKNSNYRNPWSSEEAAWGWLLLYQQEETVSESSVPDQHHNYFGILCEAFCYQRSLFSQWEASSPSCYATCQHECALYPSRKKVSRGGRVGISWFTLGIRE